MRTLERTRKADDLFSSRLGIPAAPRAVFEIEFDSIADLNDTEAYSDSYKNNYTGTQCGRWYGTKSLQEFRTFIQDGWPGLVKKLENMVKQVSLPHQATTMNMKRRRKRTRSDFGNEVDIHEVRQGRCDRAWTTTKHVPKLSQQNRLVHIVVNASANANVSSADQMWRAAAAYRLVDALRMAGKSVAITLMFTTANAWDNYKSCDTIVSVPIKEYGQDISMEQLAVMLTGGFWRHYLMEKGFYTVTGMRPVMGKGHALNNPNLLPLRIQQEKERGAHIVYVGACYDSYAAERVVEQFMSQYVDSKAVVKELATRGGVV